MFRPIEVGGCGVVSPGPGEQQEQPGTTARAKQAWRQGSDQWSSTGSRASSRPGSGQSRPQSSTVRAAQASPELGSLHQLSVTSRRAAFRSQVGQPILYHYTNITNCQKWSTSFEGGSGSPGPARRARPPPSQPPSLELDSGYPGSPASVGCTAPHTQQVLSTPPPVLAPAPVLSAGGQHRGGEAGAGRPHKPAGILHCRHCHLRRGIPSTVLQKTRTFYIISTITSGPRIFWLIELFYILHICQRIAFILLLHLKRVSL